MCTEADTFVPRKKPSTNDHLPLASGLDLAFQPQPVKRKKAAKAVKSSVALDDDDIEDEAPPSPVLESGQGGKLMAGRVPLGENPWCLVRLAHVLTPKIL